MSQFSGKLFYNDLYYAQMSKIIILVKVFENSKKKCIMLIQPIQLALTVTLHGLAVHPMRIERNITPPSYKCDY
jgi:hypothetical protein